MGVGTRDVRVDKRGAFAFAAVRGRARQHFVTREGIGAVAFFDEQAGEILHQL